MVERWSFVSVGSRSFLARPSAFGTAAGKEHGAARPTPRAGQRPAPRGNCLTQFPVCCGTIRATVERWSFVPVGSRSSLARPSADGTAAGEKSMGLPAPHPGQVNVLHHGEIASSNFPYAVGLSVTRWDGEVFQPHA